MASFRSHFGRRRFLTGALGAGAALAHASRLFAAEFWNVKDPSTWTDDEILALTSKSPWSRWALAEAKHADDPTDSSGGGGPQVGGRGGAPASRMAGRPGAAPIIVRWESAQPILDALKIPLAADFAGHYVLSVTNLPEAGGRGRGRGDDASADDTLNRLQNGAILQAKGRDPVEAGIIHRARSGSILFGFSREYLPLAPSDRDISFRLDTEYTTIKAKFDGKEMTYHGKLAV